MAINFPNNPTNGQTYLGYTYNSTTGAWLANSSSVAPVLMSDVAPSNPTAGNMWFNTTDGTLYLYYYDGNSYQWVEARAPITSDGYYSPNYIINGAFDIWQRGTTGTQAATTIGYPSADRWKVYSAGAAAPALTLAQDPSVPTGIGTTYSGKLSWSASTSTGDVILGQVIENGKYLFAGQTVTVSFWAKATSAITVASCFDQDYNGTSFNIGTSWTKFSYTLSVPTTYQSAPPTGTSSGNHTEIRVIRLTNTSSAANAIYVTGVQVELGAVATPFRRNSNSLQGELAACQRYYFLGGNGAAGIMNNSASCRFNVTYPVPMRIAPTIKIAATPRALHPTVAESQTNTAFTTVGATLSIASGGQATTLAVSKIDVSSGWASGADGRPMTMLNDCFSFDAEV